jgi:hypothetical protein
VKVLLHAGIDKAGSTAIQAHLHANREWLAHQGICVPGTGLTRFGHRKLFLPGLDPVTWNDLREELGAAEREGDRLAVLSFEGLGALSESEVRKIARYLDRADLTILFYLRDQAEVLQSGYLQSLKAGPQAYTIDELVDDPGRLALPGRDYRRMLQPFRATWGDNRLCLLPFARELLEGGDIVDDFISRLGLVADTGFERLAMQQNPSLDVPSGRYLNALDRAGGCDDRDALVDDLLWIIRRDGPRERWFLPQDAVEMLREHYRSSNEMLVEEFALPADAQRFFGLASQPWRSAAPVVDDNLQSALDELHRWPRWRGSHCAGVDLAPLLAGSGWRASEGSDDWTCGSTGVIRFRVALSRYAQRPRDLLLTLHGNYLHGRAESEVIINGQSSGRYSVTGREITVPASALGPARELELKLLHIDGDEARFCLRALELRRV